MPRIALSLLSLLIVVACAPSRLVTVADLHLGDPRSLLDDGTGVELFAGSIEAAAKRHGGRVKELIIVGDAFELMIAEPKVAYPRAEVMLERLQEIRSLERIVIVLGNHDRGIFRQLPGDPQYNKLLTEGTPLHERLAAAAGRLELVVVYPSYEVTADNGEVVHFTHGHYFDPWLVPVFDGLESVADIEGKNELWMKAFERGGEAPKLRDMMRLAFHSGQHVRKLIAHFKDLIDPKFDRGKLPDLGTSEQDRISRYLRDVVSKTSNVQLVYGHNHKGARHALRLDVAAAGGGGKVVNEGGVPVWNVSPWVTNHHGGLETIVVLVTDPKTAKTQSVSIPIPRDMDKRAQKRAYEAHGHGD